jgi:hypothetical protein
MLVLQLLVGWRCGFLTALVGPWRKIEDNINEMPHSYVTAVQYQRDIDEIKFMLEQNL